MFGKAIHSGRRPARAAAMLASVCVASLAAVSFGQKRDVQPNKADPPAAGAEDELYSRIGERYPTIRDALVADEQIKTSLDPAAYRNALAQVARLTRTEDDDCIAALRIIGDVMPRSRAFVEQIRVDGHAGDWRDALPSPDGRRWSRDAADRARSVWKHGVAAVVRDDRLLLMAGLEDSEYFEQPHNRMYVTVDCIDGPEWDVVLHVWRHEGQWCGQVGWLTRPVGARDRFTPLRVIEGQVGAVAEFAIDIAGFAPPGKAKPIWTMYVKVRTPAGEGKWYFPRTKPLGVFNESAAPGVEARWYVPNLVLLAADVGFEGADRTALAIAITSAVAYASGDDAVKRQLRQDNADLLRFARELASWQRDSGFEYCLDDYPLAAQLAWANRCPWVGVRYLSWNRTRERGNDLEDYRWGFTPVDALRELHRLARAENLPAPTASDTARQVDDWTASKAVERSQLDAIPALLERHKDNPALIARYRNQIPELRRLRESGEDVVGQYKGKPVYDISARNAAAYLKLLEQEGHYYGGCVDHAWISQCMMQAVGLAPLGYGVLPSRGPYGGHCWTGYYDPASLRWKSPQRGRSRTRWWMFYLGRVPIYPSAAMAPQLREPGDMPKPQFYWEELQGRDVARVSQGGLPRRVIRRWMLTMCW